MSVPLTLLGLLERGGRRTCTGCASSPTSNVTPTRPGVLLADHAIYRLEADLRWIDHPAVRLDLLARAVQL